MRDVREISMKKPSRERGQILYEKHAANGTLGILEEMLQMVF